MVRDAVLRPDRFAMAAFAAILMVRDAAFGGSSP
jgi:hypothetical protein